VRSDEGPRYAYAALRSSRSFSLDVDTVGGGQGVWAIRRNGLAVAVSSISDGVTGRREDLMAHYAVVEELARLGPVVPMRFGLVFDSSGEVVQELLMRRRAALEALLDEFEDKVELTLKAVYHEPVILREITHGHPEIRRLRERTRHLSEDATYFDRIRLGELVAQELEGRRNADASRIMASLEPLSEAIAPGSALTDRLVLSASFLVSRAKVVLFDRAVEDLQRSMSERIRFVYAGPIPPFSFASFSVEEPATMGAGR
jgi:hypothetical protein